VITAHRGTFDELSTSHRIAPITRMKSAITTSMSTSLCPVVSACSRRSESGLSQASRADDCSAQRGAGPVDVRSTRTVG